MQAGTIRSDMADRGEVVANYLSSRRVVQNTMYNVTAHIFFDSYNIKLVWTLETNTNNNMSHNRGIHSYYRSLVKLDTNIWQIGKHVNALIEV